MTNSLNTSQIGMRVVQFDSHRNGEYRDTNESLFLVLNLFQTWILLAQVLVELFKRRKLPQTPFYAQLLSS